MEGKTREPRTLAPPEATAQTGGRVEEKVLSGLEVEALLSLGRERLFLLFTQNRMILAHQAKMGRSAVALYGLLGKMAEGLGRTGTAKQEILHQMANTEPNKILSLHPENFAVEYPRVVSLLIHPETGRWRITLVTSDQKFEFYASPVAVEGIRDFVQSVMAGKVEYSH